MEFFKILNFWIHLISAAIWIGGILFISMVLLPTSKKSLPENLGGQFVRDLHVRFQKISGVLILLLLISGGINIHFSHAVHGAFSANYFSVLSIKIFLFGVLLSIYLLNLKNLSQIARIQPPEYIMAKILDPAGMGTVAGYPPNLMPPTLGQTLTAKEYIDLVSFLLTLKGEAAAQAPAASKQ